MATQFRFVLVPYNIMPTLIKRRRRAPKLPVDVKSKTFVIERPGALTAKAKAAHMSVSEFAQRHRHDTDLTGRQSRFYLNVLSIRSAR